MSFTPKQNFKIAFLALCAEAGLSLDETNQLVKQAIQLRKDSPEMSKEAFWGSMGLGAMQLLGKALGVAPSTALTIGVGAPILAGVGGGYAAAKATGADNKNVLEEAKHDEVIGEYDRLAEEARRRSKLKQLQQSTGRRVIALTPGE